MANSSSPRYHSPRDGNDLNRRYQQMLKQETPPYDHQQLWTSLPPDPQQHFSHDITSPESNGSPRWNDHYVAQATAGAPQHQQQQQQGYVTYDDGAYVDPGALDGQLYGYSGQYSSVGVDPTQIATTQATLQPQMYGQASEWDASMMPGNSAMGLYSQAETAALMAAYDASAYGNSGLSSMFPDNAMYNDGGTSLGFQPYQTPPMEDDKARFELRDSEYNDDWDEAIPHVPYQSPPTTLDYTREGIIQWFNTHYASRLGAENIPAHEAERPNNDGEVQCWLCHPMVPLNYLVYKQHKLEHHGVKKHHRENVCLEAPYDVRMTKQPNNVHVFEGFCMVCRQWKPLDLKVTGFNWSSHAKECQNTVLGRYITSSDEEPETIERAKKSKLPGPFLAATKPSGSRSSDGSSGSSAWSSVTDGSSQSNHSGSSINTAISNLSTRSLQQRRKAALRVRARKNTKQSGQKRPYQCTFCKADFVTYGDWRRHEENIHLVLSKWVCAPAGMYKPGSQECVYCDEVHPPNTNGVSYRCNAAYCHSKAPDDRVFSRKDHLKQHLKKIHGVTWKPSFDSWNVTSAGPTKSRCGFCGATFETWLQRMQHVGYEFKNGHKMETWQGDWGLDSYWMSSIGGAILPMDRDDHIMRLKRTSTGGTGASRRLSTYNPAAKVKPKVKVMEGPNPKRKLTKKPNFEALRNGRGADAYSMASTHDADVEDNFGHDFADFNSPPPHSSSQQYTFPGDPPPEDPYASLFIDPFSPYQLNSPPDSNANHDSEGNVESSPMYLHQSHQPHHQHHQHQHQQPQHPQPQQRLPPTPHRTTPQRHLHPKPPQQQTQQHQQSQPRYHPIQPYPRNPHPHPPPPSQGVWMSPPPSNQPLGMRLGFTAAAAANASMAVAAAVGERGGGGGTEVERLRRQQQHQSHQQGQQQQHQRGKTGAEVAWGVVEVTGIGGAGGGGRSDGRGDGGGATGETVYSCPACDKRYTRQDNLRRHMRGSHDADADAGLKVGLGGL